MLLKVGAILIGQTPRPDYEEYLRSHLPADSQIHMRGALDKLSYDGILHLPKNHGDEVLTTLDRNGNQITVASRHIHQRIPALVRELEEIDANCIVLLCTGEFPEFPSCIPFLIPSRILTMNVVSLVAGKRVSVVVPLAEQCGQLSHRWMAAGVDPTMHVL